MTAIMAYEEQAHPCNTRGKGDEGRKSVNQKFEVILGYTQSLRIAEDI